MFLQGPAGALRPKYVQGFDRLGRYGLLRRNIVTFTLANARFLGRAKPRLKYFNHPQHLAMEQYFNQHPYKSFN